MKATRILVLSLLVLLPLYGSAQVSRIVIGAGTPEDKALQAMTSEADAQKRLALLEQFNKDFAANNNAVAYGYWQMLQTYQSLDDNEKALAAGEKAVQLSPGNLEILSSVCGVAESLKDYGKMNDYAVRGGMAYNGIATQRKPENVSASDWSTQIAQDQSAFRQSYEYLEAASVNAIGNESDPRKRLAMIAKFTPAFPNSRFEVQISQLTMTALQGLNDPAKSIEFGEKVLKSNPNSVATLLLLANAYVEDAGKAGKSVEYAQKAIKLSSINPDSSPDDKLNAGMARSTLGWAYLKQDKAALAAPELKEAVALLTDNPPLLEEALYRTGFAYGRLGRRAEAKDALQKCVAMKGPFEKYAQDLLDKMGAAARKK